MNILICDDMKNESDKLTRLLDVSGHRTLTDNSSIEMSTVFAEIAPQLLRDKRFAQCHRSYIVNLNAVSAITGSEITMRSGTKIPISRSYSNMKKKYMDWGLELRK